MEATAAACQAQQPQAPRFALCIGGVIAAPCMQHHYAGSLLPFHSLHVIGERDFVRKVQPPTHPLRRCAPQSHPPFKCIICIGGVKPGAAVARPLFTEKLRLPSLHIIGERDQIKKVQPLRGLAARLLCIPPWPPDGSCRSTRASRG